MSPEAPGANQDLRPPQVVAFGPGRRDETGRLGAPLGNKALLVSGAASLQRSGGLDDILASLSREGIEADVFSGVSGEPTVDVVRPGEPPVTYGDVSPEDARRIISYHVLQGKVLKDLLLFVGETEGPRA